MPTASRTVAAAFVVSLHMVLQCSGKIPNVQQRKFHVKLQENQLNSTNQTTEDITTVIPAKPYVFSAEDYDILQDAESLQKALSVVAYEPQKIDAKNLMTDGTKGNETLVTPPSVQSTTETAPEKQYYEVPRRAFRGRRAHASPTAGAAAAQLAEEASAPRHAYELPPEAKRRSITRPRSVLDSTPSPSSSPPAAERTTTAQPLSSSETPTPARRKRRKPQLTKDAEQPRAAPREQPQVQPRVQSQEEPLAQPREQPRVQPQEEPLVQPREQPRVQAQSATPIPLDRVPRPFSIPTDTSPTPSDRIDLRHPTPFAADLAPTASAEPSGAYSSLSLKHSGRNKLEQGASATAPAENPYLPPYATDDYFFAPPQGKHQLNHLYATPYATVAVDHNHLAPHSTATVAHQYTSQYAPVPVDRQHGPPYSSAPVDPIPPRQYPQYPTPYSTPPAAQRRATTNPTDSEQQEPIGLHRTYPSQRHSARKNEQWDYNDPRPTRPADRVGEDRTHFPRQDESYATQRRRSRARLEHTTTTTSPEHQTLGYGSVPAKLDKQSRRESTQVYPTAPTWREEVQVYPTTKSRREGRPPRRKDDPSYSAKSSKTEEDRNYPTKPPRRENDPSYSAKQSRREEETNYSTKPPRREEDRIYSTKPPRREENRSYSTKSSRREEERDYSTKAPRREEESFYSLHGQELHARPTSSTRREQKSYPSTRTEKKQSFPTVPSIQSEEQDYSTVSSGSDEEQSYSTPPSRREHSQSYETASLRRPKPTLIIAVDHTAAPNEDVIEATHPPSRRKALPEDDGDYDQDLAPPTASVEQSLDYANDPQPSQALKQQQPPSEYQEYVDTTDYTDYTEPRAKVKGDDQNKDQDHDKDKGKEKDKDNKQYSFSYVERIEEPVDESGEASYNVHEVSVEEPDQPQPRPTGANPILQRGGYKIVQPIVVESNDQPQQQLPPVDYQDEAESRKADQEVAQETRHHRHKPKGDEAEDLAQSAGHHHKKHHKPKKEHHDEEEGGHAEHHEGEHHEKGHKGHKGYKEHHEHDEGKKGHHDKEGHDHHYDEKKGGEKKHHDEEGHHEEHEKGEEGEKKHAFSEKGHHKKGHSTKGEHVIHKKDAYEKKIEFYDESHEGGDHEKHGAHHHEHHHKKGGHHHKGHHHKGEHEGHHGKKGHHKKGHHHHEKKGHKKEEGDHHHHDHHHKHGKKGGHEDHKHWHHKKG